MSDVYGFAAAMAEIETELGDVMTFSGAEYPCVIGARGDSSELGNGGYSTGATLEIVVRRSLFTSEPTTSDDLTINGKAHKIVSILLSPDGACLVLTCEDANKDA